eukprot:CAMPEP_0171107734 /NCGR_PEP_ID=MMETSP0766_2-20121228/67466_1 /TAXON_ID=439317 /ORGANISM="Gambierdiscus australes, Strain CAWD 149" /LENGTH=157 /DNA_ID=CAMNT_0011569119 /DNA_START=61 /DNA_END=535 /DNA_ORIENTATION=-
MAPWRAPLVLLIAAAAVCPVTAVTWVKGSGGASCTTVCQARSGCDETAWPTSLEEFEKITAEAGHTCVGTQEGGARYDPSTDGRYCGWNGPEGESEPRCATTADSGTYSSAPATLTKSSESTDVFVSAGTLAGIIRCSSVSGFCKHLWWLKTAWVGL